MAEIAIIAGDWGTTRLRLFLCNREGKILARAEGPGIAAAGGDCAAVLEGLAASWDSPKHRLPAILSGMVGSTIGWREAPYAPCPAAVTKIGEAALRFESAGRPIAIVPGLSCRNPAGLPDVMRGEETQIIGALATNPALATGRHLFCLPGTHTKWALVEDGAVTHFQTALSGELFSLLSQHSVLARGSGAADPASQAFAEGARAAREKRQTGLLHLLFSTRSRQLAGELAQANSASYLSGLVIGDDVAGAVSLFAPQTRVIIVGTPALGALYAGVLAAYDLRADFVDGDTAALSGLTHIQSSVFGT